MLHYKCYYCKCNCQYDVETLNTWYCLDCQVHQRFFYSGEIYIFIFNFDENNKLKLCFPWRKSPYSFYYDRNNGILEFLKENELLLQVDYNKLISLDQVESIFLKYKNLLIYK